MVLREYEPFVRHVNRDGTTDSICKSCYATICTSTWETEIEQAEHSHLCDPIAIDRLKKILDREST